MVLTLALAAQSRLTLVPVPQTPVLELILVPLPILALELTPAPEPILALELTPVPEQIPAQVAKVNC